MRVTPAVSWSAVLDSARTWRPMADRALVVVPHPDDESLMFGGLVAFLARCGTAIELLAVTDGEAAYPGRMASDRLGVIRRFEQAAAVEALGLAPSDLTRVGLPDGGIATHEDELVDAIAASLDGGDIDLLVAPWEHDHHTDHEACGRAARRAAHRARHPVTVASGLFWSLLRVDPQPDVRLDALELTTWEMRRKRWAIARHASQITSLFAEPPVLGAPELAITRWSREHYLVTRP